MGKEMVNINEILEFLKQNEEMNANIINFIKNYPIHYAERIGNSVLIKGTSDRRWVYISSRSQNELKELMERLDDEDKNFAIIEDWMLPFLTFGRKIKWKLSTMRLYMPKDVILPELNMEVSPLRLDDASWLYENSDYKEFLSVEYIKDRIKNGIGSCIRVEVRPVAWALTQDDGAIGFLHVLPKYRKMGYGMEVSIDIIKKVRVRGMLPFVHIKEDNEKSMKLGLKIGFVKDRVVNWFELI